MGSIHITFPSAEGVKFQANWDNDLQEGQFEVAGQELLSVARYIRELRLKASLDGKVSVHETQEPVPSEEGPPPANGEAPAWATELSKSVASLHELVGGMTQRVEALEGAPQEAE